MNTIRYKSFLLILLFLMGTGILQAQSVENRSIGSFHGIKTSNAITVYLQKGNSPSLRVEAEGIDLDEIETKVEGGILKIQLGRGNYQNIDVQVTVTYTNLDMLAASSASGIFSREVIRTDRIEIMASSAATIEVELDAREVSLNASSAADVEVSGKAESVQIDVSSAGDIDAYDLIALRAQVSASSAGEAKVSVEQEINALASSGGSIKYQGNPQKSSTDSRSGGSVRKIN
jgi:hypothetical protein